MNTSEDNQLLSAKNEKQPLFTAESTVTWDAVKTMNREVKGKAAARSCFVIMAALLLVSEAVLMTADGIVRYMLMALAVLIPLLLWLTIRFGGRSVYEKSISRGQTRHFIFYEDYFEEHSAKSDHRIRYDELYRVIEGENCFYLLISNTQAFIVNKNNTELNALLRQYVTKQGSTAASTVNFVMLMIATALTTAFVLIDYNKPDGGALFGEVFGDVLNDAYVLRTWVNGLYYIAAVLWFGFLIYSGILRIYLNNRHFRKRAVKVVLNIVTLMAALLGMLGLGYLTADYLFNVPNPVRNDNGTFTVSVTSYAGTETLFLYEDAGPFYLHYLRPMTDGEDTDPAIGEEEWEAAQEAENQNQYDDSGSDASLAGFSGEISDTAGDNSFSGDSDDQLPSSADGNASSDGVAGQEDIAAQQIETGYRMIYNAYFAAQGDSFEEEYDAKANSYVVLSEDTSSIRYLMYDRDSQNGSCGLYVYYEVKKNSDGSWYPSDAAILDMYAYEYSTGIIADSGKTDWADAGSEEYRALTGE